MEKLLKFICIICIISKLNGLAVKNDELRASDVHSQLDLSQNSNNNEDVQNYDLNDLQRLPFKVVLTPRYLGADLMEKLKNGHFESLIELLKSKLNEENEDDSITNESEEQLRDQQIKRNSGSRRQQASRWDIGFGKRAWTQKSFMDALYGKRSSLKTFNPKVSYGRKQQWDIQYGK